MTETRQHTPGTTPGSRSSREAQHIRDALEAEFPRLEAAAIDAALNAALAEESPASGGDNLLRKVRSLLADSTRASSGRTSTTGEAGRLDGASLEVREASRGNASAAPPDGTL